MNRVTGLLSRTLGMASMLVLATSLCMEETVPSGRSSPEGLPERPFRPPYGGPILPPRRIEGGSYYYDLAEVHKRYGVYDKAVEMLQTAIEKETDVSRKATYYESLSEVYQMQGKLKDAAEQINKALAGAQTLDEKCRYNAVLARICEQAGDLDGAKKAYQFVVANASRDAEKRSAELSLLRLYQRSGEIENVIADLEKKLEKNPNDEEALKTLAQIFNSVLRQPSRAQTIYEKLSKVRPNDITILNQLVFIYQTSKEYEKAAEVYQRIIEASPSPNKSYYYQHVSRMYMLAGKKDEAVRWAEKSLSEGKTSPYTYISVAQLYVQNDLVEKALQLYERAVAASQRPIEKHQIALRFADIFAQHKREDKAEELYKFVVKEATVPSLKSQARSKLIALYRKQGRTADAEALEAEEPARPSATR